MLVLQCENRGECTVFYINLQILFSYKLWKMCLLKMDDFATYMDQIGLVLKVENDFWIKCVLKVIFVQVCHNFLLVKWI